MVGADPFDQIYGSLGLFMGEFRLLEYLLPIRPVFYSQVSLEHDLIYIETRECPQS